MSVERKRPSKSKTASAAAKKGKEERRFKYESLRQALEHVDLEHVFQRRAGFVGLRPGKQSTWWWEGLTVYRENCLTAPFTNHLLPTLSERLGRRAVKARSLEHVYDIKDTLVEIILSAMTVEHDPTLSTVDVFCHLLCLLVKDVSGDGAFFARHFPAIVGALTSVLNRCELTEHCQYAVAALTYIARAALDSSTSFSKLLVEQVGVIKQTAIRRVCGHKLFAIILQTTDLAILLSTTDAKLVPMVVEAVVEWIAEDVKTRLPRLFPVDGQLSQVILLRLLLAIKDVTDVWRHITMMSVPVSLWVRLLALRKGTRTRLHCEILAQLADSFHTSDQFPLLMALFVQCVPVDAVVACRERFRAIVSGWPVDSWLRMLFYLHKELGFQNATKWNLLVGNVPIPNIPFLHQTIDNIDWSMLEESHAKAVAMAAFCQANSYDVLLGNKLALSIEACHLNHEALLLALASEDDRTVRQALLRMDSELAHKLVRIVDVPATLQMYRERANLMSSTLRNPQAYDEEQVALVMFFLLGQCQVKLTLLLSTVQEVLSAFCAKFPQVWSGVFATYTAYLSDPQRATEEYCLRLLPPRERHDDSLIEDELISTIDSMQHRCQVYASSVDVRFGEWFASKTDCGYYGIVAPSAIGNVLKVVSNVGSACSPISLEAFVSQPTSWNANFVSAVRGHFLPVVKAYTQSSDIKDSTLLHLIGLGELSIQELAAKCWLRMHFAGEPSIHDKILPLLNDKTYRECLLAETPSLTGHAQWPTLMRPMLSHLIYGRLISRTRQHQMVGQKRKAFLTFIDTNWSRADLSAFLCMLQPNWDDEGRTLIGYLSLLASIVQYVRLDDALVQSTVQLVCQWLEHADKRVRSLAMKRLVQLIGKYGEVFDLVAIQRRLLPLVERLQTFLHSDSSLLKVLSVIGKNAPLETAIQSQLVAVLGFEHIKSGVLMTLVQELLVFVTDGPLLKQMATALIARMQDLKPNSRLLPAILTVLSDKAPKIQGDMTTLTVCLVPMLSWRRLDVHTKAQICTTLAAAVAASQERVDVAGLFALVCDDLIVSGGIQVMREPLCRLLMALSMHADSLSQAAVHFQDLFAVRTVERTNKRGETRMEEEPDHERRLAVFTQNAIDDDAVRVVANGCFQYLLYDMGDHVMRNHSLNWLIHHMATSPIVQRVTWRWMPVGCRKTNELVRFDMIVLLAHMLKTASVIEDVCSLQAAFADHFALYADDNDCFADLTHMQRHRRLVGLERLSPLLPAEHVVNGLMLDWLFPWTFDSSSSSSSGSSCSTKDGGEPAESIDGDLQRVAQKAYADILVKCEPTLQGQKLSLLITRLTSTKTSTSSERACLKLLALILSEHPSIPLSDGLMDKLKTLLQRYQQELTVAGKNAGKTAKMLTKRLPLTIALGQCGVQRQDTTLVHACTPILVASLKKVNFGAIRATARRGLLELARQDPTSTFLLHLVKDVHERLCADGNNNYEQIGHFMIGTLLEEHFKTYRAPLDDDAELQDFCLRYLADDLFAGSAAWQRLQADWTGKVHEAKQVKAFDVLAAMPIGSGAVLDDLLARLRDGYARGHRKIESDPTKVSKLKQSLQRALNILSQNLITAANILDPVVQLANPQSGFYADSPPHAHYWQLFAVQTGVGILRKRSGPACPNAVSSELSTLKQTVLAHLQTTRHSSLLGACLKFAQFALDTMSLQERKLCLLKAFEVIVQVHGQADAKGSDAACRSEAFKWVCQLLDLSDSHSELTDQQVKALLVHCRTNFDSLQRQQMTFALLKRLLRRCATLNAFPLELYLLMEDLQRAVVQSPSESTRSLSAHVFATFVRECPLSPKRRLDILSQLQADAFKYHHAWGRQSARSTLALIVPDLKRLFDDNEDLQTFAQQLLAQCAHGLSRNSSTIHKLAFKEEDEEEIKALNALWTALLHSFPCEPIVQAWLKHPSESIALVGLYAVWCVKKRQDKKLIALAVARFSKSSSESVMRMVQDLK